MRAAMMTMVLIGAGLGVGCMAKPDPFADRYHYFVPGVAMRDGHAPPQASQVLPASDGDVLIARGDKGAYGAVPVGGISTFAIYTRDSQAIYVPGGGSGYRHRWIIQQGVSAPIAP